MNNEQIQLSSALAGSGLRQPCVIAWPSLPFTRPDDLLYKTPLRAGGIPGQPDPDTPDQPDVPPPEQPTEPGNPTSPDEPPPDLVV